MAAKERPIAIFAPSIRSIKVYESGRIEYQKKSGQVAERVALYDGWLEIDDRDDEALAVRCRLPLGAGVDR
jgi:hypothetical protein